MQDDLKTEWQVISLPTKIDQALEKIAPQLMEWMGTLLLVFVIELSGASPLPPLSIGFGLMILVFWGGHVSGAHYNPAVTLAVLVTARGHVPLLSAVGYWVAQLVGGMLGAFLSFGIIGEIGPGPTVGPNSSLGKAFGFELVWTFVLASVVLNTSTTKHHSQNSFYGLAIGTTVFVGASLSGQISGGAFNPAVGTGTKLLWYLIEHHKGNDVPFDPNFWIYWVAPCLGGLLSALFFRLTNIPEYKTNEFSELEEKIQ